MEAQISKNEKSKSEKTKPGLEVDIRDLSHDGRGVARVGGKTVFVSGALAGERVRLGRVMQHRRFDEAEIETVLTPSGDRVAPRCVHVGHCAGCVLQHQAPEAQILAKQNTLIENLKRIGDVEADAIAPPLTAEPWAYRRRGRLSVRHVHKKGKTLVGFREPNGKYVADVSYCHVVDERIATQIEPLARLIETLDARETLPQIEFAAGDETVALVIRHLQALSETDRAALIAYAKQSGLAVLLQPGGNDSVHPLWPEQVDLSFAMPAHRIEFAFEPLDFIQINGALNLKMIDRALEWLRPHANDRVLDLFCGLGNFTLPIARQVATVTGVEGEHSLIQRARANAARNTIANVDYVVANLFESQQHEPWFKGDYNKIVFDPPRAGAEMMCQQLPGKNVQRIVYVSCHPGSLARDAGILVKQHGFRLRQAGVMDMFPHTAHVESVALFER